MAGSSVAVTSPEVKQQPKSYVSPLLTDKEAFKAGRKAYMAGKPLIWCQTDGETSGWLFQEARCADAYYSQMMAQANEVPENDYQWIRTHC